ncbi:hypothetical protein ARV1_gp09 [Acidianus rod-shaped virus 1]|uniref:Uncharacterized protein n=1 Tax=Acidianus rod-shaped virus 1 TaxID=309181 RepID=Q50I62_9VIRU|nr:hypothetical protein ARV1_gp09 [Acidianus rod-shaped virus 1]CAI44164.1 hypothetical protein [Acidianus rod-shaped virus 1]
MFIFKSRFRLPVFGFMVSLIKFTRSSGSAFSNADFSFFNELSLILYSKISFAKISSQFPIQKYRNIATKKINGFSIWYLVYCIFNEFSDRYPSFCAICLQFCFLFRANSYGHLYRFFFLFSGFIL